MLNKVLNHIRAFSQCRAGATAIEYALLAAGISCAVLGTMFMFSDSFEAVFSAIGISFETVNSRVEAG